MFIKNRTCIIRFMYIVYKYRKLGGGRKEVGQVGCHGDNVLGRWRKAGARSKYWCVGGWRNSWRQSAAGWLFLEVQTFWFVYICTENNSVSARIYIVLFFPTTVYYCCYLTIYRLCALFCLTYMNICFPNIFPHYTITNILYGNNLARYTIELPQFVCICI